MADADPRDVVEVIRNAINTDEFRSGRSYAYGNQTKAVDTQRVIGFLQETPLASFSVQNDADGMSAITMSTPYEVPAHVALILAGDPITPSQSFDKIGYTIRIPTPTEWTRANAQLIVDKLRDKPGYKLHITDEQVVVDWQKSETAE